ncbi:hypothetical protein C7M84_017489 [Penaeus vannamei]|uniref:Uncharacterized protein n=1 Tax=Penaeus vannamei TaxID=6689 RepID=A0A3R7PZK8_PENVA|nr:hypothetical protein C7M84_017489 [Penaeus vannamei]
MATGPKSTRDSRANGLMDRPRMFNGLNASPLVAQRHTSRPTHNKTATTPTTHSLPALTSVPRDVSRLASSSAGDLVSVLLLDYALATRTYNNYLLLRTCVSLAASLFSSWRGLSLSSVPTCRLGAVLSLSYSFSSLFPSSLSPLALISPCSSTLVPFSCSPPGSVSSPLSLIVFLSLPCLSRVLSPSGSSLSVSLSSSPIISLALSSWNPIRRLVTCSVALLACPLLLSVRSLPRSSQVSIGSAVLILPLSLAYYFCLSLLCVPVRFLLSLSSCLLLLSCCVLRSLLALLLLRSLSSLSSSLLVSLLLILSNLVSFCLCSAYLSPGVSLSALVSLLSCSLLFLSLSPRLSATIILCLVVLLLCVLSLLLLCVASFLGLISPAELSPPVFSVSLDETHSQHTDSIRLYTRNTTSATTSTSISPLAQALFSVPSSVLTSRQLGLIRSSRQPQSKQDCTAVLVSSAILPPVITQSYLFSSHSYL